ncbi:hypothetical protein FXO38_28700 [Capsicum annuum]|nr:hypothetical protein FXO38_28700 [Capsicum annuum]
MAHIIATTLMPRKGSLINSTCGDVFVLFCTVTKLKINWANWFCEYMLESAADAHTSTSLPYGLLITRIILYHSIDRAAYPVVEVFATYDSNTFASMGYFLDLEDLKDHLKTIEEGVIMFQESTAKLLELGKGTRTDIVKVRLTIDGFNQEGIKLLTKVLTHM